MIDRRIHTDMRSELSASAFGDCYAMPAELERYVEELVAPMIDEKDDTSALWASRIVIARCVYALTTDRFKTADLRDENVRAELAGFILRGLNNVARRFGLQKGRLDGQKLLPTTLACIRYAENSNAVVAETVWAGDSRCYALTSKGLKLLSVDDEDGSGSITNLFCADDKKVKLNYLRHEIEKPCVLMAVSDGVFDPFEPHDHLGVEHALFAAINESRSVDELSAELKKFYDGVHGDDATMAFAAFGFVDFSAMREYFKDRASKISAVMKKQKQLESELEVVNQTEEEASHYALSRTGDRFDHIVTMLVDAMASGTRDVAIAPEFEKIVEDGKRGFGLSAEKRGRQDREQYFIELYRYVKSHPELISSQILSRDKINFHGNYSLQWAFSDMKKYSSEYVAANDGTASKLREQLKAQSKELHDKVMERIICYRNRRDGFWDDKTHDQTYWDYIDSILRVWQNIEKCLKYGWTISDIGKLPEKDRVLAYEARNFIDKCKEDNRNIKSIKSKAETAHKKFVEVWDTVFKHLKNNPEEIRTILSPDVVHKFGFDVSDADIEAEIERGRREAVLRGIKEQKVAVVNAIVGALARNFDKTSIIDGQYNPTKLELFRTFYRLKSHPDSAVKKYQNELAELEAAYTSYLENKTA